jgi:CheY-like chemotaxis protein
MAIPPRTILLAEDDPRDVELTLEAMSEQNFAKDLVVVRDGVEVMEYLRREGRFEHRTGDLPAVLLLDIKMPRMDGIEVLEAIRSDEKLKALPVVMLTHSCEESDLKRCYALNANAYVVKPGALTGLMDAVKHIGVFWSLLNEPPLTE